MHQIQFHRTARAFKHKHIAARFPFIERLPNERPDLLDALVISLRLEMLARFAEHNELRAHETAWFEQNRVHLRAWLQPARFRLRGLRAPDLASVERDERIVRHVLRLEWRDTHSAPP